MRVLDRGGEIEEKEFHATLNAPRPTAAAAAIHPILPDRGAEKRMPDRSSGDIGKAI